MEDAEKKRLVKDEYLHLQKVIEDFDARTITIKAWSVTFSLAAIAGAFVSHAPIALLVGSFSAVLFWFMEGTWKTFQVAYYARNDQIEDYFAEKVTNIVPMQIGRTWLIRFEENGNRRVLREMRRFYVALPHAGVFLAGLLLYVLYQAGIVLV